MVVECAPKDSEHGGVSIFDKKTSTNLNLMVTEIDSLVPHAEASIWQKIRAKFSRNIFG